MTTKCVDPYINKLDVSSRITQKMSHLAIQRSRRRYIGPDARKDGTTVKARLRAGEDCEEWDLLLTDIPAVVASGVEVHSRNADFATPMFTEVTPRYIVNGVYAGVSINSTEMFGQIQSHTPSYRSITKNAAYRPVPKLVSSLFHGVVTQFNFSDKHWREGQPLLMGPEYMPEDKQPPRVTWYPVQSDDLFHSSIAALLATAFGRWHGEWGVVFWICGEHLPVDVDDSDKTNPPEIYARDSAALAKFLRQQRLFGWTRLSYVAAKVIGSKWRDNPELCDWIKGFYEAEMAYEMSDERRDESSANLLQKEAEDLLVKIRSLDTGIDLVKEDQRAQLYVSTVLANATAIDMADFASRLVKNIPGDEKKKKETEEMIEHFRQDPEKVLIDKFLESAAFTKKSMMGIYKRFIVDHLRGLSLDTVAPNSYGLVQIM